MLRGGKYTGRYHRGGCDQAGDLIRWEWDGRYLLEEEGCSGSESFGLNAS